MQCRVERPHVRKLCRWLLRFVVHRLHAVRGPWIMLSGHQWQLHMQCRVEWPHVRYMRRRLLRAVMHRLHAVHGSWRML